MIQDPAFLRLQRYFRNPALSREIRHPDPELHARAKARRHELREAAVLIPVVKPGTNSMSQVILTLRSANLSSHAGQISLPGGSREAQDVDAVATALRETSEEIGIPGDAVEVLGSLGEFLLPSGFRVTPVIGLVEPDPQLLGCPHEVEEIFLAPLSLLLDLSSYKEATWQLENQPRKILEVQYEQYRIWGATAVILHHLASAVQDSLAD